MVDHRTAKALQPRLQRLLLAQQRLMLLRRRVHPLLIPAARATHDVSEATELACAVQAAPDGVVQAWRDGYGDIVQRSTPCRRRRRLAIEEPSHHIAPVGHHEQQQFGEHHHVIVAAMLKGVGDRVAQHAPLQHLSCAARPAPLQNLVEQVAKDAHVACAPRLAYRRGVDFSALRSVPRHERLHCARRTEPRSP
eukprot:6822021-Prymnesium_polylepis.1